MAPRLLNSQVADDWIPPRVYVSTIFTFMWLMIFGHTKEFFLRIKWMVQGAERPGYSSLVSSQETFFTRHMYYRIRDCWNRPINSVPGNTFHVMIRESDDYNVSFRFSGESRKCVNLSSYNYLGFGENSGPCVDAVRESVKEWGLTPASPYSELGRTSKHVELEELVARFLGKDESIVFGMGYATNSTNIPALVGRGDLVVSDRLNHASLVYGIRSSGASVKVFKHNDPKDLDKVLRNAIIQGQPRTHRAWRKILVVVEGIYSMEGEVVRLKEIVEVKKKYGAYLFVDEAHSIGAMGKTGRGIHEHAGVPASDIDVFMGTFTKSFGSVGGYIAADASVIQHIRHNSEGVFYAQGYSVPCAQMCLSTFRMIMGEDGTSMGQDRLDAIKENSNYFRARLEEMGFRVIGEGGMGSPVIPMMVYVPAAIGAFSRLLLERGVAVVMAGFPATELLYSRVRFCISSAHTREELDKALDAISEVGDLCGLKYMN